MLEKIRVKSMLFALMFAASFGLAACDNNDGPMEEAGEKIDDAVDELD